MFSQPSYEPMESKFSPTAPFWDNSLGQTIFEYDTTALYYVTPSPNPRLLLLNDEYFIPIHEMVSNLPTLGGNIRRRSLSPFPGFSERANLNTMPMFSFMLLPYLEYWFKVWFLMILTNLLSLPCHLKILLISLVLILILSLGVIPRTIYHHDHEN